MSPPPTILHDATLFATPLWIAAAGELVVERAGVVNIGIEGMMLAGALAAWVVNAHAGPTWGWLAAIAAAGILAALFALAVLTFSADQIVTGTGINLLALGATALAYKKLSPGMAELTVAGARPVTLVILSLAILALAWGFLARTRWGLELSALGEAPEAADSAGVAVNRRRLWAIFAGAACAGVAGAYLSTVRVQGFVENMTEGDGFLALAIVIFGRWQPGGILLAGLFFGIVRAFAMGLETRRGFSGATEQLFKVMPYAVSLLALAGVAGRSGAPASLGRNYQRN
jgi:simple sugar transport system permease protein